MKEKDIYDKLKEELEDAYDKAMTQSYKEWLKRYQPNILREQKLKKLLGER